jgi:hypothetical protein
MHGVVMITYCYQVLMCCYEGYLCGPLSNFISTAAVPMYILIRSCLIASMLFVNFCNIRQFVFLILNSISQIVFLHSTSRWASSQIFLSSYSQFMVIYFTDIHSLVISYYLRMFLNSASFFPTENIVSNSSFYFTLRHPPVNIYFVIQMLSNPTFRYPFHISRFPTFRYPNPFQTFSIPPFQPQDLFKRSSRTATDSPPECS